MLPIISDHPVKRTLEYRLSTRCTCIAVAPSARPARKQQGRGNTYARPDLNQPASTNPGALHRAEERALKTACGMWATKYDVMGSSATFKSALKMARESKREKQ